jgi:hypothetical protein
MKIGANLYETYINLTKFTMEIKKITTMPSPMDSGRAAANYSSSSVMRSTTTLGWGIDSGVMTTMYGWS